jgi:tetratricopeptide (TPR) repeat protein
MSRPTAALLAVIVTAALAPAGVAATTAEDVQAQARVFARAMELHRAGDVLGAIDAYEEFLQLQPGNVEALSNLGAAYARLGKYTDAIAQYRSALAAQGGHAAVRFNLAVALYKSAQISEAAQELARVVAAQADNKPARLLLADCYLQLGRDRDVVDLLSPVESAFGDDRGFAYLLGTSLIRLNELQKGQALIERIMGTGDSAEARLLLGAARARVQDHKGALDELRRAREMNPRLPLVNSLYGRALLATGDRTGAGEAFLRELDVNPNDFESNLQLGLLRKDEHSLEEAAAFLTRAGLMRPNQPDVLYALGTLYIARGEVEKAASALEEVVRQAPEFVQAHVLLATVYYRLKRKEEGDRERAIVQELNAEAQARTPGAQAGRVPPP